MYNKLYDPKRNKETPTAPPSNIYCYYKWSDLIQNKRLESDNLCQIWLGSTDRSALRKNWVLIPDYKATNGPILTPKP